jgi:proteasome lid subunit RPN8/RPN11
MLDHIRGRSGEEVCGLLAGLGNEVEQVIPIENMLHSPYRFRMEPRAQVRAILDIEDSGLSLVGIYHSHPAGPSGMSDQDVREAAYPEAAYLVWSTEEVGWRCRAFRLEGEGATEISIVQTEQAGPAKGAREVGAG